MKSDPFIIKNNNTFHELMSHRVHEILLVASPYDAFILEEDGGLTEQIMTEYIGMNFNYAPRVTRASTASNSMAYLSKDNFDLVIVMLRIEDTDPISLGKTIKKLYIKSILLMFINLVFFKVTDLVAYQGMSRRPLDCFGKERACQLLEQPSSLMRR